MTIRNSRDYLEFLNVYANMRNIMHKHANTFSRNQQTQDSKVNENGRKLQYFKKVLTRRAKSCIIMHVETNIYPRRS